MPQAVTQAEFSRGDDFTIIMGSEVSVTFHLPFPPRLPPFFDVPLGNRIIIRHADTLLLPAGSSTVAGVGADYLRRIQQPRAYTAVPRQGDPSLS